MVWRFRRLKFLAFIMAVYGKERWIKKVSKQTFNKEFNHCNPETFNEKIQFLKLVDKQLEHTIFSDKFKVRNYVKEVIGEKYLIPVYAYLTAEEVKDYNFSSLQKSFAIKATHGSGWVDIIREKDLVKIDWEKKRKLYMTWLTMNYYNYSFEPQYKRLKPGLIIEHLLLEGNSLPEDIKIHCFEGVPKYIHVATGRESKSGRAFYDTEWNRLPFHWTPVDKDGFQQKLKSKDLLKPSNLNEILDVAKKLAQYFHYVRVDLYNVEGMIFFGELTFHPGSGFDVFFPNEYDSILGGYLDISERTILRQENI